MNRVQSSLLIAVAAFLGGAGEVNFAEAQSPAKPIVVLPLEVQSAMADWAACRGMYVGRHIKDQESAEAIANAAIADCQQQQQAYAAAVHSAWKGDNFDYVTPMRESYRKAMITDIEETRRGASPSDPGMIWGNCIAKFALGHLQETAEPSLAERALSSCSTDESNLDADLSRKFGPAQARVMMEEARAQMRAKIIPMIEEMHASR